MGGSSRPLPQELGNAAPRALVMERLEVMLTGHSPLVTGEMDRKAGQGCRVYNLQNGRMGSKMGLPQQAYPRGPHSLARLSRDPGGLLRLEMRQGVMRQPLSLSAWFREEKGLEQWRPGPGSQGTRTLQGQASEGRAG